MTLFSSELVELAATAPDLECCRSQVLAALVHSLEADVGLFATLGPTGRPEISELGMTDVNGALESGWEGFGREILAVQRETQRAGASTDRRVLGGAIEQTKLHREVIAPLGGSESLFVVPAFGGRKLGFVMLGRCGNRLFTDAELSEARALGPSLSVICAAFAGALTPNPALANLSETERELLEYLELGYGNREIAAARGTSFFTVRNQLSTLYRKLGVSNRTEAVGLRSRGA